MSPRGGRRPGAGRKPGGRNQKPRVYRTQVALPQHAWEAIDDWAHDNEIPSRSRAVRELLALYVPFLKPIIDGVNR